MDILDKLAEALARVGKLLPQSFLDQNPGLEWKFTTALQEFNQNRPRTVVLTFEKAKEIITGSYATLDIQGREPRLTCFDGGGVNPSDGEYAYAEIPPLPGPEVFK
jgi:hypothetical protein